MKIHGAPHMPGVRPLASGTDHALSLAMATRAESYRADQQRKNQASKPKKTKSPPRTPKADSGFSGTALRNLKTSPSHVKAGPALEDAEGGRPSRKSTRSSSGHVKLATNLQRRQIRRVHSPEARAAQSAVR
jgi:hypothetical protein